jgi:hypothetical protein
MEKRSTLSNKLARKNWTWSDYIPSSDASFRALEYLIAGHDIIVAKRGSQDRALEK